MNNLKGLHFITGEKGGVGKSLFTMVLLEYLNNLGIKYKFYDADRSSPDVGLVYGESYDEIVKESQQMNIESVPSISIKDVLGANCNQENSYGDNLSHGALKQVYFSEDELDSFRADRLQKDVLSGNLVVANLPAQVEFLVNKWLVKRNILENFENNECGIYYWFVTDGSLESLELLERSLKQYGNKIRHILVRNKGLSKLVDQNIMQSSALPTIHEYMSITVEMPQLILSNAEMQTIKSSKVKLSDAMKNESEIDGLDSLSKLRIKSFLKHCHIQIDRTFIFATKIDEDLSIKKSQPKNEEDLAS